MQASPTRSVRSIQSYLGIILAGAYFLVINWFYPLRETFEFDPDEGIELIKAMLVARGDRLYTQIWNEQPPLFTYLLALNLRLFGFEVEAGRLLVLATSAVLIAAVYYTLLQTWGGAHALSACLLIMLLPFYNQLSVSVMIGLPAIALALLSLLALVGWHKSSRRAWLLASAALMALSVLTKLITAFIAPVMIGGLLLAEMRKSTAPRPLRESARPALIWGLAFTAVGLGLGLVLVGPGNVAQLLRAHLLATGSERYADYPGAGTIYAHLRDSWAVLLLALIGGLLAWRARRWLSLYPLAWAVLYLGVLSFYRPVWYHHQLLVTIPAAMLGGVAAGEGLRLLRDIYRRRTSASLHTALAALALPVFIFGLIDMGSRALPDLLRPPVFITHAAHIPWPENMFLVRMSKHAPQTEWLVTNMPMFAFRTGMRVPPDLAVIPEKRLNTGLLTEAQLLERLVAIGPEQVLIGRREFPLLEAYLDANYRLLYERGKRSLYVRK